MTAGTPRIYRPNRRQRFADFGRRYAAMITVAALTTAAIAGGLALGLRHMETMSRDTAGHPVLSGPATVSQVAWLRRPRASLWGSYSVEVEFQGERFWTNAVTPFYLGQRVTLYYRIGRSGFLYPVNVSP